MAFRDYTEIAFEAGNILSAQMLEETYRYPREFLQIFHANYCDGIISGLDFVTKDDGLYLTPGIIKLRRKFFILPQEINLDTWLNNLKLTDSVEYNLFFVCKNFSDIAHGFKSRSRIYLKAERELPTDCLLLGKYKFRAGAKIKLPKLRIDNEQPFEEFFQSGLFQLLQTAYSHPQSLTTFHPAVFRAIQEYLEQKFPLSPYDFSLLSEIQNRGIVSQTSLKSYIAANKKVSLENLYGEKLFREIIDCLKISYQPAIYFEKQAEDISEKKSGNYSKLI